ncbi:hypothetical protein K439DRAFT_1640165, partial [Ramaria rubella]
MGVPLHRHRFNRPDVLQRHFAGCAQNGKRPGETNFQGTNARVSAGLAGVGGRHSEDSLL